MTLDTDKILFYYLPNIKKLNVLKPIDVELPLAEYLETPLPFSSQLNSTKYVNRDYELLVFKNATFNDSSIKKAMNRPISKIPTKLASIHCKACKQMISKRQLKFKELPGNNWNELIDCWSCHQSEFAVVTERLKTAISINGENLIVPKTGYVLFDGLFMICSQDDLMAFGKCTACNETLGDEQVLVEGYERLWIPKLVFNETNGELENDKLIETADLESCLFNEIVQCLEEQSTRFIQLFSNKEEEMGMILEFLSITGLVSSDLGKTWQRCLIVNTSRSAITASTDATFLDLNMERIKWPRKFLELIESIIKRHEREEEDATITLLKGLIDQLFPTFDPSLLSVICL